MAATFSAAAVAPLELVPHNEGHWRTVIAAVTVSGTYTTGGDALAPGAFGLDRILLFVADMDEISSTTGAIPRYDYANNKLKFYESGASGAVFPEKGNGESVAGTFRCMVIGL